MSRMQDAAAMVMLAPVLSPHGVLTLVRSREADAALVLEVERGVRLEQAFARGCGHGLLVLGADEVGTTLPPTMSFWQKFGARYLTALCSLPGIGERSKPPVPIPADGQLRPLCLPGDLHNATFGRRQGSTSPARQGFAGICGRQEPRTPPLAFDAGTPRLRALPMAKSHGRRRRDFSPTAMEPTTGAAVPARRSSPRKRWRHCTDARELAHESSRAPAGEGHGWRQRAVTARARCAA